MSHSIKCPECGEWNENTDHCYNCNHLLNYQLKREQEEVLKKQAHQNTPPTRIEIFYKKLKSSTNPLDKLLYYLLQSAWFILIVFSTFAIAFAAIGPG
ncbi:MAG: hypothetical protein KA010_02890 [Saprospiraceae bacterium]|nr:hypothetical protein [Saprospiraceae bacterium]